MRVPNRIALAVLLLGAGGSVALAQDATLDPTFGATTLAAGFEDDPFTANLTAGGAIDAAVLGPQCSGYISAAPDYRLTYTGTGAPLIISVVATDDTTLVVAGPDGWYCNDDASDQNPAVQLSDPAEGDYAIWVGTRTVGATAPARLYVSAYGTGTLYLAFIALNTPPSTPDHTLPPTYGEATLAAGFSPDPYVVDVHSGGPINPGALAEACDGFIANAPVFGLNYTAGTAPLYIAAQSAYDTTLVIRDPDGNWICDDDTGGNLNPLALIPNPISGRYDIWVGTYGDMTEQETQLIITANPG